MWRWPLKVPEIAVQRRQTHQAGDLLAREQAQPRQIPAISVLAVVGQPLDGLQQSRQIGMPPLQRVLQIVVDVGQLLEQQRDHRLDAGLGTYMGHAQALFATPASSRLALSRHQCTEFALLGTGKPGEADGHGVQYSSELSQHASHRCDRSCKADPSREQSRAPGVGLSCDTGSPAALKPVPARKPAHPPVASSTTECNGLASQPAHELGVSRLTNARRIRGCPWPRRCLRKFGWLMVFSGSQPYGCEMRSINHSG